MSYEQFEPAELSDERWQIDALKRKPCTSDGLEAAAMISKIMAAGGEPGFAVDVSLGVTRQEPVAVLYRDGVLEQFSTAEEYAANKQRIDMQIVLHGGTAEIIEAVYEPSLASQE